MAMKDRKTVAAKIDFEGGIIAALEYGLTEDDMPEDDEELRSAWRALQEVYRMYEKHATKVDELLP